MFYLNIVSLNINIYIFGKIARKLPFLMSGSSSRHQTFPTEILTSNIFPQDKDKNIYDNKIKK